MAGPPMSVPTHGLGSGPPPTGVTRTLSKVVVFSVVVLCALTARPRVTVGVMVMAAWPSFVQFSPSADE
jgi:hypothetical protein